jgi:hypothetical protein
MESATHDQIETCQRFGSAVTLPDPSLKAGIALHTLHLKPLNALRHPPEGKTCGWYIWGGEHLGNNPAFFSPLHVSHLANYCPSLLPYLALAPGWRVLLAPPQEEVWYDESLLNTEV